MQPPEFSVVVPAYQATEEIAACVTALKNQTAPPGPYEIIVVDDGSTDGTAQAADEAGADRVRTIPHGGVAAARNAGVEIARGPIVLFTDADCVPAPDWLTEMVRPFSKPAVAGVKGAYCSEQQTIVARLAQCEFEERYDLLERQDDIDFVDTYSAAFRREVFQACGGFNPALPNNEDVEFSYRVARSGYKMAFNRRAVVRHQHPAGWWAYLRTKVGRGYWRTVVYRRYPGKSVRDSYTPQLLKLQVLLVYLSIGMGALAVCWPVLLWAAAAGLVGLLGSAIPFARLAARRAPDIALWSIPFIVVRALAFAVGIVGGVVDVLVRPRRLVTPYGTGSIEE